MSLYDDEDLKAPLTEVAKGWSTGIKIMQTHAYFFYLIMLLSYSLCDRDGSNNMFVSVTDTLFPSKVNKNA